MIYDFSVIKSPTPGGAETTPCCFYWITSEPLARSTRNFYPHEPHIGMNGNESQIWRKQFLVDSTLTQMTISVSLPLTRLKSLIFTTDSTLTLLIWVRVESNLTHSSMSRAQPVSKPHLWMELQNKSSVYVKLFYRSSTKWLFQLFGILEVLTSKIKKNKFVEKCL